MLSALPDKRADKTSIAQFGNHPTRAEHLYIRTKRCLRVKHLSKVIEQDHREIIRRCRASQCFRSFHTAERALEGIGSLHMMRRGQVKRLDGRDAVGQAKIAAALFGIAA